MITKLAQIVEPLGEQDAAGAPVKRFQIVGEGRYYETTDAETLRVNAFSQDYPEVITVRWLSSTLPQWVSIDGRVWRVKSVRKMTYWPRGGTLLVLEEVPGAEVV